MSRRTGRGQRGGETDDPEEAHSDERWLPFNLAWKDVLLGLRVLDPACGSGAFLVAAYDCLSAEYDKVNRLLARTGQAPVDVTEAILQHNLFGVDLNAESVEITKLSLWLKTAVRDRKLTDLDWTIRQGNSVIADVNVHEKAFDWQAVDMVDAVAARGGASVPPGAQPVIARWQDGFDVVLGNPPYVRQEWLEPAWKAYWKQHSPVYDGTADLYVYFFDQALRVAKVGGLVGFITNNKWLRAGYGKPLRQWLVEGFAVEQLVDFGHARIFEGTDTFPCVTVVRKEPGTQHMEGEADVCVLPREVMAPDKLAELVKDRQFPVVWTRLRPEGWVLERAEVDGLMARIRGAGTALRDVVGMPPIYGLKTGCNQVFLIDQSTRDRLVAEHPSSDTLIKPYLRGEDVGRWAAAWNRQHMIFARRGIEIEQYPAVLAYLEQHRKRLEPRPDDWQGKTRDWPGRKSGSYRWYEVQDAVDQWPLFEQPKIVYQDIQSHPRYAFDDQGHFANNTVFFLPSADLYLLGVLNSPLVWWFNWRHLEHAIGEALRPFGFLMETLPIATPTPAVRSAVESRVSDLVASKRADHHASRLLLDWLRAEHGIASPGRVLEDFGALGYGAFEVEVKKRRPKDLGSLKPAHVAGLRDAWETYGKPTAARRSQAAKLEDEVARLVEQAYGLSEDDVNLLWETAPVRMPGQGPNWTSDRAGRSVPAQGLPDAAPSGSS